MRTVLRRVDPISLAKIYAAVYGILMLLFALPAGCFVALGGAASDGGGMFAGIGLFLIVLYPIFGAIAGFIGGLLVAVVYNLVADRVGGVELEFDDWGETDIL